MSMFKRRCRVNGFAEMMPGSRRREANSPNVSCLCGTWQPRCGLNAPVPLSQERANSTAGVGRRKKRRPAAERHGECVTRRIVPDGIPRKGADVRLAIYPKAVVKELQPGGKVRCSLLQT